MLPNWLNTLIDSISILGVSKAIKDGINNTTKYKDEINELNNLYNSTLRKKGNKQEVLAFMIDKLNASSLPIPTNAMRNLNQYKDKLMKQSTNLQSDIDALNRERDMRQELAQMADSMPVTYETDEWYEKQKNLIQGELNNYGTNKKKEEEI